MQQTLANICVWIGIWRSQWLCTMFITYVSNYIRKMTQNDDERTKSLKCLNTNSDLYWLWILLYSVFVTFIVGVLLCILFACTPHWVWKEQKQIIERSKTQINNILKRRLERECNCDWNEWNWETKNKNDHNFEMDKWGRFTQTHRGIPLTWMRFSCMKKIEHTFNLEMNERRIYDKRRPEGISWFSRDGKYLHADCNSSIVVEMHFLKL